MPDLQERPAVAVLPGLRGGTGRAGRVTPPAVALAIVLTGQIMAVLDKTMSSVNRRT